MRESDKSPKSIHYGIPDVSMIQGLRFSLQFLMARSAQSWAIKQDIYGKYKKNDVANLQRQIVFGGMSCKVAVLLPHLEALNEVDGVLGHDSAL